MWFFYLDAPQSADNAVFFDSFDESVPGPVVGNGQAQGLLTLVNLYFLRPAFKRDKVEKCFILQSPRDGS